MSFGRLPYESVADWLQRLIAINAPSYIRGNVQVILESENRKAVAHAGKVNLKLYSGAYQIYPFKKKKIGGYEIFERGRAKFDQLGN
jgi:hypothetical protein